MASRIQWSDSNALVPEKWSSVKYGFWSLEEDLRCQEAPRTRGDRREAPAGACADDAGAIGGGNHSIDKREGSYVLSRYARNPPSDVTAETALVSGAVFEWSDALPRLE